MPEPPLPGGGPLERRAPRDGRRLSEGQRRHDCLKPGTGSDDGRTGGCEASLPAWIRSADERAPGGGRRTLPSVHCRSTAEAHTFLGWALSHLGRHQDAIAECKAAISLDPDFGNPYNDIGAYLIALGRDEEAIHWLERAKTARRYEPRHYPYFNLARIYIKRHRIREAIRELEQAVRIEPGYTPARRELHRLLGMLN